MIFPNAADANAAKPPKKLNNIITGTALTIKILAKGDNHEISPPQDKSNGKTKICAAKEDAAFSRNPAIFGKNLKTFLKKEINYF